MSMKLLINTFQEIGETYMYTEEYLVHSTDFFCMIIQ